jgi:threonine dehydrogenase-like Zn-dependent dehydrogenase
MRAMKALRFERNLARYAAARVAGTVVPGRGAAWGPLKLRDVDVPDLPTDDWVRVRPRLAGICGSDLATVDGRSSRYFEPIVSFPFVPGHEVVGERDDGSRVVLEAVLGCAARGIDPPCAACARGDVGRCERIAFGDIEPGLQTGFCCETGGGWSTLMVAHPAQLHDVGDELSDEAAVMVEPAACAIRAALAAGEGDVQVVLGAGTLGLLTVAALRRYGSPGTLIATARYPHQKQWARELGADVVVDPDEAHRAVRRATGAMVIGDTLTSGADTVVDCVGAAETIATGIDISRAGGRVVLCGMPGTTTVDLTPLWHKEVALVGAYAYGRELDGRRTFDLAFELARDADLGRLVSATYPLDRYQEALEHAAAAGPRGAVKIAFDLRNERERESL